jgi:hypothetical protein
LNRRRFRRFHFSLVRRHLFANQPIFRIRRFIPTLRTAVLFRRAFLFIIPTRPRFVKEGVATASIVKIVRRGDKKTSNRVGSTLTTALKYAG